MSQNQERISLTMEQFDDSLKEWKHKGTERCFWAFCIAAFPLAVAAPFISDVSPAKAIYGCILYFGFILTGAVLFR